MKANKKAVIAIFLTFIVGLIGGYYYGHKSLTSGSVCILNGGGATSEVPASAKNFAQTALKIDLLKDYTDFVLLPKEKIADPVKYADMMGAKVKTINDSDITAKFYATGEIADKEQKILDFLDLLNGKIKSDLQ